MLHMKRLMKNEIQEAALFIAKLNTNPKNYIGYCGTDSIELFEALQEDFIDGEHGNIVVVLDDTKILALVGFDLYEGNAEVWGPFCEPNYQ